MNCFLSTLLEVLFVIHVKYELHWIYIDLKEIRLAFLVNTQYHIKL
jgi:hypothetical protein